MELHSNARTCPATRLLLVRRIRAGILVTAAEATGTTGGSLLNGRPDIGRPRRRRRWSVNRGSRRHREPRQTYAAVVEGVLRLRWQRQIRLQIATRARSGTATVARISVAENLSRDCEEPTMVSSIQRILAILSKASSRTPPRGARPAR
jgi:hypothetical protein